MDKRIDLQMVSNWVFVGRVKFDLEFDEWYAGLEDDPNGVVVPKEELRAAAHKIMDDAEAKIVAFAGKELPEPVIEEEEEEEELVIVKPLESLGTYSCNEYEDKSACRLPVNFSKYNFPVKFVFSDNCGSFSIPTPAGDNRDTPAYNRSDYVYFKYEKGSPAVFTKKGCAARSVEVFKVVE